MLVRRPRRRRHDSRCDSIVKVDVGPVEPIVARPGGRALDSYLEKAAETVRNRDFISSQTSVACAWVENRPHEKEMTFTQEVPVKGGVFSTIVRARMRVRTSG